MGMKKGGGTTVTPFFWKGKGGKNLLLYPPDRINGLTRFLFPMITCYQIRENQIWLQQQNQFKIIGSGISFNHI